MAIPNLFDKCAAEYDRDRRKLVPAFDAFYGTLIQLIPFDRNASIQVLDLGAGTGLVAGMVAAAFPSAKIHLTDISEPMLAKARQRFAGNPLITYAIQKHEQLSASNEYDLVVSSLSIHHLDDAEKKDTFRRIYCALKPGGMFINADQVLGPSPSLEEQYEREWRENAQSQGISAEALNQAQERRKIDKNALLADQLSWLKDAGFIDVDCWYKHFRFAVFGGKKSL